MSVPSSFFTAVAGQAASAGLNAISGILSVIPKGSIGGITIDATIEETLTDTLQVTEHPVEEGAQITDHSYVQMPGLVMRCGWSNASANSLLSLQSSSPFDGGRVTVGDYVSSVYSQLVALLQSGTVFDVVTSIRMYTSMLITSLALTRDAKTSQALMVTATMRQVRIVSTSSAKLPPTQNQATPADTAENTDVGTQSLAPGTPSPNGSVPPAGWS